MTVWNALKLAFTNADYWETIKKEKDIYGLILIVIYLYITIYIPIYNKITIIQYYIGRSRKRKYFQNRVLFN